MEKKELLNEENYERAKKKITRISLVILVIALLLGGTLITLGIIKTNAAKNAAYQESQKQAVQTEQRLKEIESEKESLNLQYDAKSQECDSLDHSDKNWFAKVNQCRREAGTVKSKINDLESEEFALNHNYNKVVAKNYIFLSILGGMVIFIGGVISLSIYLIAKKRDIAAFTIQQSMPLAQETIEKMAPTVGNAAGTIGKGIAKGITSGIKEGLKTDENKEDKQ